MKMKRGTLMSFLVACVLPAFGQDLSNSIEYGQLYIVGDATGAAWDLGSADEMRKIAEGVFEWTGHLAGGKEFKFMNTREAWHKHIVASESGVTVGKGEAYRLNFYADWGLDGSLDLKFRMAETGEYTVVVDLTAMRMTVTEPARTAQWPDKFYLTGTSVDNQVVEVPNCFGAEFKKVVSLKPGNIKLMDTPSETDATTYYVPRFSDVDVTYGDGFYSPLYSTGDKAANGWSVAVAGDYSIYLDILRETYLCRRYKPAQVLYLVGGCCERGWNYWDESNCLFLPDPANPEVMVWEGELRIGWEKRPGSDGSLTDPEEPDKFKILTAKDWFLDTYHPYVADAPAVGESAARISGGYDLKWTIEKDGVYRLELDTKTEVLKGTYLGPVSSASGYYDKPMADVERLGPDVENRAEVRYYNLQGMRIEAPSTVGVYIKLDGDSATKFVVNGLR